MKHFFESKSFRKLYNPSELPKVKTKKEISNKISADEVLKLLSSLSAQELDSVEFLTNKSRVWLFNRW